MEIQRNQSFYSLRDLGCVFLNIGDWGKLNWLLFNNLARIVNIKKQYIMLQVLMLQRCVMMLRMTRGSWLKCVNLTTISTVIRYKTMLYVIWVDQFYRVDQFYYRVDQFYSVEYNSDDSS